VLLLLGSRYALLTLTLPCVQTIVLSGVGCICCGDSGGCNACFRAGSRSRTPWSATTDSRTSGRSSRATSRPTTTARPCSQSASARSACVGVGVCSGGKSRGKSHGKTTWKSHGNSHGQSHGKSLSFSVLRLLHCLFCVSVPSFETQIIALGKTNLFTLSDV